MNKGKNLVWLVLGVRVVAILLVVFFLAVTYALGQAVTTSIRQPLKESPLWEQNAIISGGDLRKALQAGVLPANMRDRYGRTGLMVAVMQAKTDWIDAFLNHGNSWNQTDVNLIAEIPTTNNDDTDNGNTALTFAMKYQIVSNEKVNQAMVEKLLDHGANPNVPNIVQGRYPIHFINTFQDRDVLFATLKILIDAGADINVQDKWGYTIIHYFAERREGNFLGKPDLLHKILVDYRNLINLDLVNSAGYTALAIAQQPDKSGIDTAFNNLPPLLGADGRVNERDTQQRTGLMLAIARDDNFFVQEQLYQKADVNAQDNKGDTPLHYAMRNRQNPLEYIRELLKRNANPMIANNKGKKPLDLVKFMAPSPRNPRVREEAERLLVDKINKQSKDKEVAKSK